MKCPFCGFANDKVVDSRESKEADSIRRRRECLKCEKRFTTYERIDEIPYMVVKKDGRTERSAEDQGNNRSSEQSGSKEHVGQVPSPARPSNARHALGRARLPSLD